MKLPFRSFAAVTLLSMACAAWAQVPANSADAGALPAPAGKAIEAPETPEAPVVGSGKPYLIGPLDILDIRIWNDQKMSGPVAVRPDGVISLPLIGEIKADGLTVSELTKTVASRLTSLMNDPEVNIQVAKINSKKYYLLGEVARGGEFPLIGQTTVLDALANCGGFRDFANPKKIYVLRGKERLKFNYNDVKRGKNMEQNIVLQNGDRIFVP